MSHLLTMAKNRTFQKLEIHIFNNNNLGTFKSTQVPIIHHLISIKYFYII